MKEPSRKDETRCPRSNSGDLFRCDNSSLAGSETGALHPSASSSSSSSFRELDEGSHPKPGAMVLAPSSAPLSVRAEERGSGSGGSEEATDERGCYHMLCRCRFRLSTERTSLVKRSASNTGSRLSKAMSLGSENHDLIGMALSG